MTLTEKWDKGELPEGDYYIKRRNGDFLYDNIDTSGVWRNSIDEDILEVLAPVPSYEEWQELKEASDGLSNLMFKSLMNRFIKADEEREKLAEENKQLKELLNYIRDEIADMPVYAKQMGFGWIGEAAYRIDNATGEK